MTTLIAWYSSDGCEGRCDAKCYNAISTECDCICGGRNHGKGLDQALDNTRQMAGQMIAAFQACHNLPCFQAAVNENVYQLSLF